MTTPVDVDNFALAESHRMFRDLSTLAGGTGRWFHARTPTSVEAQPVIRMNRDTLYSMCVVDLAEGATFVMPETGGRYVSAMVVDEEHYVERIIHEPGRYELAAGDFATRHVLVLVRTLADPNHPEDLDAAHRVQDGLAMEGATGDPFAMPDYDERSLDGVRDACKELGRFMRSASRSFGRRGEVDPIRHLIGCAIGWGGLPDEEATYLNVDPALPVGEYRIVVGDVPVDAFWSISVYNAEGFFEPNDRGAYSVNSVTAVPNADGTVTVHLGGCGDDRPNCLPITEGWNYIVRLYRPHPEVLDGTWTFPSAEPIG